MFLNLLNFFDDCTCLYNYNDYYYKLRQALTFLPTVPRKQTLGLYVSLCLSMFLRFGCATPSLRRLDCPNYILFFFHLSLLCLFLFLKSVYFVVHCRYSNVGLLGPVGCVALCRCVVGVRFLIPDTCIYNYVLLSKGHALLHLLSGLFS